MIGLGRRGGTEGPSDLETWRLGDNGAIGRPGGTERLGDWETMGSV